MYNSPSRRAAMIAPALADEQQTAPILDFARVSSSRDSPNRLSLRPAGRLDGHALDPPGCRSPLDWAALLFQPGQRSIPAGVGCSAKAGRHTRTYATSDVVVPNEFSGDRAVR